MDTISASNVIGLAFHLFEKGIITEKDIGFPLALGRNGGRGEVASIDCPPGGNWKYHGGGFTSIWSRISVLKMRQCR